MKVSPKIGSLREHEFFVSQEHCIDFDGISILATPHLLWEMEHCALDLLQESLEEGELSLGVQVDLEHRSMAIELDHVICTAKVVHREGPLVTFHIAAEVNGKCLSQGLHKRRVVDRAGVKSRLESLRMSNLENQ
jgi:predicted thioesterase